MTFYNRTRRSASIPRRLIKERRFHLLPIYYLMSTSFLGRECIENGGSYRFADHIYAGNPKGRYLIGYALDWFFLRLKSARSFRYRYVYAKEELHKALNGTKKNLHVLAAPSGYAREVLEVAKELPRTHITWHFLDLDRQLLQQMRQKSKGMRTKFWHGNALDQTTYGHRAGYDAIVSMGFTEFLDDTKTVAFYKIARQQLRPGGVLVTSGMRPYAVSEYLMRHLAELRTSYRSEAHLRRLAKRAGFRQVKTYKDPHELQTMMIARR